MRTTEDRRGIMIRTRVPFLAKSAVPLRISPSLRHTVVVHGFLPRSHVRSRIAFDGQMQEPTVGSGPVPMHRTARNFHDIARRQFPGRSSLLPITTASRRADRQLSARMNMPFISFPIFRVRDESERTTASDKIAAVTEITVILIYLDTCQNIDPSAADRKKRAFVRIPTRIQNECNGRNSVATRRFSLRSVTTSISGHAPKRNGTVPPTPGET